MEGRDQLVDSLLGDARRNVVDAHEGKQPGIDPSVVFEDPIRDVATFGEQRRPDLFLGQLEVFGQPGVEIVPLRRTFPRRIDSRLHSGGEVAHVTHLVDRISWRGPEFVVRPTDSAGLRRTVTRSYSSGLSLARDGRYDLNLSNVTTSLSHAATNVLSMAQEQRVRSAGRANNAVTPAAAHVLDTDVETFESSSVGVERVVRRRDGRQVRSLMGVPAGAPTSADSAIADKLYLTATTPPPPAGSGSGSIRVVDLFSGCGGLTLGVNEAARALGMNFDVRLAVDFEPAAMRVFNANFAPRAAEAADITTLLDGRPGSRLSRSERALASQVGDVEILVGGPPCQGHSDLNNRTRRADDKNQLYFSMVRAAEVFGPEHILIENVPGALNDRSAVVQRSMDWLRRRGYEVTHGVVDMSSVGVPQRRKRLVVPASRRRPLDVQAVVSAYAVPQRDVAWAIGDLVAASDPSVLLDAPCNSSPATTRRIDYLFANGLYDLPDAQRPPCHARGGHSYSSIYGRLAWDQPSQTVTTGFYSMCMGRYVHPSLPRTLTAHEAARLQVFPDFFDFSSVRRRGELATMIGNAVPMKLSYLFALELMR